MAGIKVFAPATVANVACGFDLLGFAIDKPGDEIIGTLVDKPGVRITKITGDNGRLPLEASKNTAGVAAIKVLEYLKAEKIGIELEIHKKMPFGSGLGSSAASAAAAVVVVNELLKRPFHQNRDLLPFAVQGEAVADGAIHADNVAPSLMGGIVFCRDNATLDVHRISVPAGLHAVVVHPKIEILTKDARNILSKNVTLKQSIQQNGNLGGLLIGLYHSNFELIKNSLQDVIIEPQRAQLIPQFYNVKNAALENGALGCSISGAGPSIFALCKNSSESERIGIAMQKVFKDAKIKSDLYISPINMTGAYLC